MKQIIILPLKACAVIIGTLSLVLPLVIPIGVIAGLFI